LPDAPTGVDGGREACHNYAMLVIYEPQASQDFIALPRPIQERVRRIAERLQNWPNVSGVKALRGNLAGRFRIRTGDYRVQFRVAENRVLIERVGHRDGFYED
jgi:mRNA-degrading endonuclease RelE of RelBE toxin-antitoxin system